MSLHQQSHRETTLSNADHPTWGSAPPAAFCARCCSAGLLTLWAALLRAVCMNRKPAPPVIHLLSVLAGESLDTEDGNVDQHQLRHAFGSVPFMQVPGSDALMEEHPDSEPIADLVGGTNSNDTGAAAQPMNSSTGCTHIWPPTMIVAVPHRNAEGLAGAAHHGSIYTPAKVTENTAQHLSLR